MLPFRPEQRGEALPSSGGIRRSTRSGSRRVISCQIIRQRPCRSASIRRADALFGSKPAATKTLVSRTSLHSFMRPPAISPDLPARAPWTRVRTQGFTAQVRPPAGAPRAARGAMHTGSRPHWSGCRASRASPTCSRARWRAPHGQTPQAESTRTRSACRFTPTFLKVDPSCVRNVEI